MSFLTKMRTTKTVLSQTKTEKCSTVQRAINKRTCVPRHPTSRAHNNLIKSLPAFQSYNRHSSQKALAKFLQAVHRRQRHRWSRQISNNFTSVLSYLMQNTKSRSKPKSKYNLASRNNWESPIHMTYWENHRAKLESQLQSSECTSFC